MEGNLTRVTRELTRIRFPVGFDASAAREGDPAALLPALHYAMLGFSRHVTGSFCDGGFDLQAKTDGRFVEHAWRALRESFGYNPKLTPQQFLSPGFAERKLMLLYDAIELCKRRHNEHARAARAAQSATAMHGAVPRVATATSRHASAASSPSGAGAGRDGAPAGGGGSGRPGRGGGADPPATAASGGRGRSGGESIVAGPSDADAGPRVAGADPPAGRDDDDDDASVPSPAPSPRRHPPEVRRSPRASPAARSAPVHSWDDDGGGGEEEAETARRWREVFGGDAMNDDAPIDPGRDGRGGGAATFEDGDDDGNRTVDVGGRTRGAEAEADPTEGGVDAFAFRQVAPTSASRPPLVERAVPPSGIEPAQAWFAAGAGAHRLAAGLRRSGGFADENDAGVTAALTDATAARAAQDQVGGSEDQSPLLREAERRAAEAESRAAAAVDLARYAEGQAAEALEAAAAAAGECDAIARRLAQTNAALAEQTARAVVLEGRVRVLEEAAAGRAAAHARAAANAGIRTAANASFHAGRDERSTRRVSAKAPPGSERGSDRSEGAASLGGAEPNAIAVRVEAQRGWADGGSSGRASVAASGEWGTASLRGSRDGSVLAVAAASAGPPAAEEGGRGAAVDAAESNRAFIDYYSRLLGVSAETLTEAENGAHASVSANPRPSAPRDWD